MTETHHELAVIPRAPRTGAADAPLSFAQERLFLLDRIMPGLPVYDRVGVDDDFFALGGHSLLAVQMLALVEWECDVDLPLTIVFQKPTVRTLATAVTEHLLMQTVDGDIEALSAEVEAVGEPRQ